MTTVSDENSRLKDAEKHYENGQFKEAIDIYTNLLTDEQLKTLHVDRARCYYELGEYQSCLDDINNAKEPGNIDACILGGKSATELKEYEEAYKHFKAGLDINAKNPSIVSGLHKLQKIILDDAKDKANAPEQTYDALKLCSQDPYPGDDMLLMMEKEILQAKYKIPCPEETNPNPNKKLAVKEAKAAHSCRMQNNFVGAIEHIDKAVVNDQDNWVYRQFRGEIFFQRGQPIKTLQSFWAIPKELRTLGVWKLGGQILRELKMPILTEFWLKRVTKMSKGEDTDAAMIFQQVRVERLYSPLTQDLPVYVDFTKYGRAIHAKDNIKQGDLIFTDLPIVMAQSLDTYSKKACFSCGACLMTAADHFADKWLSMDGNVRNTIIDMWPEVSSVKCEQCKRERYCNEECRKAAWGSYHGVICPGRNKAAGKLYDICENNGELGGNTVWSGHFSPMVLVKIWASIASTAISSMKEDGLKEPATQHWSMAKAPYRKFIAYGVAVKPSSMPEFSTIVREMFQDCGGGVKFEITDQEFSGRYCQASCNLQSFGASFNSPYSSFLTRLNQLNEESVFKLFPYINEQSNQASFAGMFPLHACLNHACDNNVEVSDGFERQLGVSVRAKRDIKKGEELFTTYIDTSMPRMMRRAWIYRSFNFWCNCLRCQFEGDDAHSCTECGEKAADDKNYATCGACKKAWYCSQKCQKKNWSSGHKRVCKLKHSKVDAEKSPMEMMEMLREKIREMPME